MICFYPVSIITTSRSWAYVSKARIENTSSVLTCWEWWGAFLPSLLDIYTTGGKWSMDWVRIYTHALRSYTDMTWTLALSGCLGPFIGRMKHETCGMTFNAVNKHPESSFWTTILFNDNASKIINTVKSSLTVRGSYTTWQNSVWSSSSQFVHQSKPIQSGYQGLAESSFQETYHHNTAHYVFAKIRVHKKCKTKTWGLKFALII